MFVACLPYLSLFSTRSCSWKKFGYDQCRSQTFLRTVESVSAPKHCVQIFQNKVCGMFPKKFSAIAAIHGEDPLITLKCTSMLKKTLGAALFYIKMLFYI